MATARARAAQQTSLIAPEIELPTADLPQYVNEDGYEVDAQTFALALQQAAGEASQVQQSGGLGKDEAILIDEGDFVLAEETLEVAEPEQTEGFSEEAEPLLSLSESNVLHYSVVSGRQHHLQQLLPHLFSHPAIPANSRPRARPPPKGTFLYPTPPPLVHPLPHREYHAPTPTTKKPVDTNGSPAPDAVEVVESKRRKYGRNKGKSKADENQAPAHDIECIARVTLSIGPFSFPDTELWVGRFVQPRAAAPKPPRAKKVPGERKKAWDSAPPKRPDQAYPPLTTNPAVYGANPRPPIAGPSGSGYRPRPPMPPPTSGPPGPPRPPAAPRAELSPDLIKRVNEAATQHSWLSQIIHKAARSLATKEELAKLGRVVNRLKDGKDVGENAQEGITPNMATSSQAGPSRLLARSPPGAAPSGPSAIARPPAALDAPQASRAKKSPESLGSDTLTPPPGNDSDDDSDVDMKGPQQVGGGGPGDVDPYPTTNYPSVPHPVPTIPQPPPQSSNTMTSAPTQQPYPHPYQHPSPHTTIPPRDSSSFASPPPVARPPIYQPGAGSSKYQPHAQTYAAYGMAPPVSLPPRPTYNLPPPFLLVAFKEAPTEKFQIPLGSLSYISRVGDKDEAALPVLPSAGVSLPTTPAIPSALPSGSGAEAATASRTRGSQGKVTTLPALPVTTQAEAEPAETPKTARDRPLLSGMPRLPGASPPDGIVLISTFVPGTEWNKPDWEELATRLPFSNPNFDRPTPNTTEVKVEPAADPSHESNSAIIPKSPRQGNSKSRSVSFAGPVKPEQNPYALPISGKLLNIAAESFLPEEGDVHAVTIRLSDVTDQTWQRLKTINGMVTTAELKTLSEHSPELMPKMDAPTSSTSSPHPESQVPSVPTSAGPAPPRPPFQPSPELRADYAARKKAFFRKMLSRVPARKFLRYRLGEPQPDLVDATTDKWGPKSYPISTKALSNRDVDYDGQPIPLSPTLQPKRGNKRAPEPDVTFELPVSLDQLDAMVADHASKGKKGKGLDGRKRHGKRWVAGAICEGCARTDKSIWRSGPGGPRTLCNSCGDLFSAGELGPLKAPGAAHKKEGTQEEGQAEPAETANEDRPVVGGQDGGTVETKVDLPGEMVTISGSTVAPDIIKADLGSGPATNEASATLAGQADRSAEADPVSSALPASKDMQLSQVNAPLPEFAAPMEVDRQPLLSPPISATEPDPTRL